MPTLTLPAHVNGPPGTGNGGWSAGALVDAAALAPMRTTVQLRRPPPLEVAMEVGRADGLTTATHDGTLVMRAHEEDDDAPAPVPPVDVETARAAEASYAGHRSHPFPTCVVCGVDRAPGDGMRIFPGRVADADGRTRVAATWTPASPTDVSVPATWAALDCIGAWAGDLGDRLLVLGSMTLTPYAVPAAGRTHVVVGADRGTDGGRRRYTAASLYGDDRLIATAEHVWFTVDPKDFS